MQASNEGPIERLNTPARISVGILGAVGLVGIVLQTFNLSLFGVFPLLSNRYYYLLIGIFLAAAFLLLPPRTGAMQMRVNLVDWVLAALALACLQEMRFERFQHLGRETPQADGVFPPLLRCPETQQHLGTN